MLADLSLVGCYNMSTVPEKKRAQLLLESAKKNLRDMAFFGLTEYQRKTQFLFERTFRLRFIRPFMQYNSTRAAGVDLDNATVSVPVQSAFVSLGGQWTCNRMLNKKRHRGESVIESNYTHIDYSHYLLKSFIFPQIVLLHFSSNKPFLVPLKKVDGQ